MTSAAIETRDVRFRYQRDGTHVLDGVSFTARRGEILAIMGPNGCGKSTLMRVMMGLLKPESGSVRILGMDPGREPLAVQRRIGYMPQKEHIEGSIPVTVRDVVLMGRLARKGALGVTRATDLTLVREALEYVGMDDRMDVIFSELSGGQQQRVLLARALAVEPEILLLDEPFAGMDVPSKQEVVELLEALSRDHGVTTVVVVHDVNPLVHVVDDVLLLNRSVVAVGDPFDVLNESNLLTTYGAMIPIVTCEDGYCHPLIGDTHG